MSHPSRAHAWCMLLDNPQQPQLLSPTSLLTLLYSVLGIDLRSSTCSPWQVLCHCATQSHQSRLSSFHSVGLGSLLSQCSGETGNCSQETPRSKVKTEVLLSLSPHLYCSVPLLLQTCGNACLLISSSCDLRPCDLARGRWGATHPVDPLLRRRPAVLLGKQNVK